MRSLKPALVAIAVIIVLALFASLAVNSNYSQAHEHASAAPDEAQVDGYADDDPMRMEIPDFKDEVCDQDS